MFDRIAPRYDLVNRLMTFGMDVGWRRLAVSSLALPSGSVVLDVACGTGDLCNEIERRGMKAIGVDYSAGMLAASTSGARLVLGDALALPLADETVDAVTCGFALRNVTDLSLLFDELFRVTRSRGRIALLEVAEPSKKILRVGHAMYFNRFVPLIGGLLSDKRAYSYLPRSVEYLPEPEALIGMIEKAGFTEVRRRLLGLGAAQLLTARRG